MNNVSSRVWVALVHLKPSRSNNILGSEREGAYVNAIVLSGSKGQAKELINEELKHDGLVVVEVVEFDEADSLVQIGRLNDELKGYVGAVSYHNPVLFDTFDTYRFGDS